MKPYLSTNELVTLLADERKLAIGNRDAAITFLNRTNYYRFTGYSRYFQIAPQEGDNEYFSDASFESITGLMAADDELRIRLLIPLSELEISLRAQFARIAGNIWGDKAFYLDPSNYISSVRDLSGRIESARRELADNKSAMVRKYRTSLNGVEEVPVWVAVEVLSFGKISWMLESLNDDLLRTQIADEYSFARSQLVSVIRSLSALRNLCAHHGQLWNRALVIQCPAPQNKRERPREFDYEPHGLFNALLALEKLVQGSASQAHLAAIKRRLIVPSLHADGVLRPKPIL